MVASGSMRTRPTVRSWTRRAPANRQSFASCLAIPTAATSFTSWRDVPTSSAVACRTVGRFWCRRTSTWSAPGSSKALRTT